MRVKFLPASNGDCILITTDKCTILIDGGLERTYYRFLREELLKLNQIDLVILTHIDKDHIAGLIELFRENEIKVQKVWFNSIAKLSELFTATYQKSKEYAIDDNTNKLVSYKQGETLEELLEDTEYELIYIEKQQKYYFHDLEITLLSPYKKNLKRLHKNWEKDINNREANNNDEKDITNSDITYSTIKEIEATDKFKNDTSLTNKSSIAFILGYQDKNYLFLGDANVNVITKSLKNLGYQRLEAEFIKLSHHGSKKNINQKFLDIVDSNHFIVSTDGSGHNHPDKETFARIILNSKRNTKTAKFIFNYEESDYPKFFESKELNNKKGGSYLTPPA